MDKKRLEIIITLALVPVLIFAWAGAFSFMRKRSAKPKPKPAVSLSNVSAPAPPAAAIPLPAAAAPVAANPPEEDGGEWQRDPFSGKNYAPVSSGGGVKLQLSGIIWDAKKPYALFGEEVVREGDTLAGYKIAKINKNSVIVTDGVRDSELRME